MQSDIETGQPQYLTTKEVAELLRIRERKVYDMVAAEEIPHRRMTGKLLFPRTEILAWIGEPEAMTVARPAVLTGSHDPLLDWALRESVAGLSTLWTGSAEGLDRFAAREAALTGLHLPDDDGWNIGAVAARGLRDAVMIGWARRSRGLILSPGLETRVSGLADLKGRRLVQRQAGAGAQVLLDRLLAEAALTHADFATETGIARTETDAATAIAAGEADAALGLEAVARQFNLPFLPLTQERFDLLICRRAYFEPPVQKLLSFARGEALRAKATAMAGYDLEGMFEVRWLSP
ncbi:MAG: helix-turn-helix transcriptional regulator [Paracoccaceae bacterium]